MFAARCDSSGLGASTCESDCNTPSHGLCSNANKDLEACRTASGITTAVTSTTAAMTGNKGSCSNPVNSIIRSHRLETSPALPQPDPPGHEEAVMVRSRIYKKLLWQMTVGGEAESIAVDNVYLGRLQLVLNTGEPLQLSERISPSYRLS